MIIENGTIVLTRFPPMFSSSSPSFKRVIRERRPWLGLRKKEKSSTRSTARNDFDPLPIPLVWKWKLILSPLLLLLVASLIFGGKKNRGYPRIVTSGSPSSSLNFQPRSPSSELGKGRAGRTERRRSNKEGKRRGGPRLAGNKLP